LKASRYNYVLDSPDGRTLFFNFYTLSLLTWQGEQAHRARRLLADPKCAPEDDGLGGPRSQLVDKGFLVEDQVDELALLRLANRNGRLAQRDLSLTIAPTLECNFRCTYCYQPTSNHQVMSPEVEDAVVRFAETRLMEKGSMGVTWFGGEPLLRLDIVNRLSERLQELCDRRQAGYTATMISNGFLCNRDTAAHLAALKVREIQITLDGPPDYHDRRRVTANGKPTFQRIIENIKSIHDIIRVNLRMNVDQYNRDAVEQMLDLLAAEGLARRVGFYLGQVQPYTEVCRDVSGHCLSDDRFSLLGLQTLMKMAARGFTSAFNIPRAVNSTCIADNLYGFVIAPSGAVGKCWNEIADPSAACGHVLTAQSQQMKDNCLRWQERDPFELECADCILLPICMGGCPYTFLMTGKVDCHRWKYHLEESLLLYYYLKRVESDGRIIQRFQELVETVMRLKDAGSREIGP